MEEHPVEIPRELKRFYEDWCSRALDEALTEDGFHSLNDEMRRKMETLKGTDGETYLRILKLREANKGARHGGAGIRGELHMLECTMSPCFCESGKNFGKCHGVSE